MHNFKEACTTSMPNSFYGNRATKFRKSQRKFRTPYRGHAAVIGMRDRDCAKRIQTPALSERIAQWVSLS